VGKVSYQSHACGGDTETLEYDKNGNYSYRERTTRESPIRRLQVVQSSSNENKIICTKPLQTASNVEYKRPPSPCKIM
jgi:hypothetical protein